MTIQYVKLPQSGDRATIKCFYKHDGKYGEFFLHVDSTKREITFESKEPTYQAVLADAFAKAMREF